jgi:hypothetical protein
VSRPENDSNSTNSRKRQRLTRTAIARGWPDDREFAAIVKKMEIPNYEAWFRSTSGLAESLYTETCGNELSESESPTKD